MKRYKILVTEGQHLAALGAIRSFGRAGHSVAVGYTWPGRHPLSIASRYTGPKLPHPDPWQSNNAFCEWLQETVARDCYDVIVPISEAAIVACDALANQLPPALVVLSASRASRAHTLSKYHATALAQECGLSTPPTVFLGRPDAWDDTQLETLGYPCVIKSDNYFTSTGAYLKGESYLCADRKSAAAVLASNRDSAARFIAQTWLPGHGEGAFLLRQGGECRLHFAHRRLHEVPWKGGWSVLRESLVDPALVEQGNRLLAACDHEGLAMVEFRRGADGIPYFLEINGRLWGSIALAQHAGIDFPLAWLEWHMTAQSSADQRPYRAGMRSSNFFPGELAYLHSVKAAARAGEPDAPRPAAARLAILMALLNPRVRSDEFWFTDPGPGFAAARTSLSESIQRLRFRLQEVLRSILRREHGLTRRFIWFAYGIKERLDSARARNQSRRQRLALHEQIRSLEPSQHLLFVCYGNICRSPFAATYWNSRIDRLGLEGPRASSSGYYPEAGRETPGRYRRFAQHFGIGLDRHRSTIVNEDMVQQADLVLVMDEKNHSWMERHFSQALGKTQFLGSIGGSTQTIQDPYGLPDDESMAAYRQMKAALDNMLDTVLLADRRKPYPLRIFMYHGIPAVPIPLPHFCFVERQLFIEQIDLLDRHYDVLPLTQALQKLQAGRLERPTAVITFDDGFHNNYTVAWPELKRRGLPATIFVSTSFVDSDQTVWFCRILLAVYNSTVTALDWQDEQLELEGQAQRIEAANRLMERLKCLPHDQLEMEVSRIENLLGVPARPSIAADSPFRMLSSAAICEMAQSGLVEFGGHTHSHAILSRLSREEQGREIKRSLDALTEWQSEPCKLFAYPNGTRGDIDAHSIDWMREYGVSVSVLAEAGANAWSADPLRLGRDGIGPLDQPGRLEQRIRHMIAADCPAVVS